MPINIDNTYRIKRSLDQEEKMQYLWKELKIFNSYSQILTISALIGYVNNVHIAITKAAEPVQVTFFEEREKEIMNFLAYMMAGNQSILQEKSKDDPDRHKMYEAFEAYANGGFPILCKKLEVDFTERNKNDRLTILQNYYIMLLTNNLLDI